MLFFALCFSAVLLALCHSSCHNPPTLNSSTLHAGVGNILRPPGDHKCPRAFKAISRRERGAFLDRLPETPPELAGEVFHSHSEMKQLVGDMTEPAEYIHHNYEEMTTLLKQLAEIPDVKIVANMHGNEVIGREAVLALAYTLLHSYGENEYITTLLNNTRIHLLPSINPDGYERAGEGDFGGVQGRYNADGVDLNRDFADFYDQRNGLTSKETQAVESFIKSHPFVLSLNLHGGALVASYPYDGNEDAKTRYTATPDDSFFKKAAFAYSKAHSHMYKGSSCPEKPSQSEYFPWGVTNGAAWYALSGGMQDFNYAFSSCFDVTIEMSCTKYPMDKELQTYWNDHKYSLLAFTSLVHTGVMGRVVDSETAAGIPDALVHVAGNAKNVTSASNGDYWRPLTEGQYEVIVEADGYESQTQTVNVTGTLPATRLVFRLKPCKTCVLDVPVILVPKHER